MKICMGSIISVPCTSFLACINSEGMDSRIFTNSMKTCGSCLILFETTCSSFEVLAFWLTVEFKVSCWTSSEMTNLEYSLPDSVGKSCWTKSVSAYNWSLNTAAVTDASMVEGSLLEGSSTELQIWSMEASWLYDEIRSIGSYSRKPCPLLYL